MHFQRKRLMLAPPPARLMDIILVWTVRPRQHHRIGLKLHLHLHLTQLLVQHVRTLMRPVGWTLQTTLLLRLLSRLLTMIRSRGSLVETCHQECREELHRKRSIRSASFFKFMRTWELARHLHQDKLHHQNNLQLPRHLHQNNGWRKKHIGTLK